MRPGEVDLLVFLKGKPAKLYSEIMMGTKAGSWLFLFLSSFLFTF